MPERKLGEPVFGVLPIQVLVDTCCRSKVGFRRLLPITGQSAVGPKPAGLVEQYLPFNKAPNSGRSGDRSNLPKAACQFNEYGTHERPTSSGQQSYALVIAAIHADLVVRYGDGSHEMLFNNILP